MLDLQMTIFPHRVRRARQAVAWLTERAGIDNVHVANASNRGDVRVPQRNHVRVNAFHLRAQFIFYHRRKIARGSRGAPCARKKRAPPSSTRAVSGSAASGFVNINQRGQMQVTGIHVGNNQVIVNANAEVQTIFFRLAGISSLSMRVEGRAYPAFGINVEGQ